jgi:TPR repeat protein
MLRLWNTMSGGIRSMLGRRDARAEVNAALDSLHGIKASERRLPEVDDALKMSPSELSASKSGAELRKLANYAYHGVGTAQNVSLATGLWSAGAMKGDLECTYSLAQSVLQGVGLAAELYGGPNEAAAEEIFEAILKQVPHGWSMFSLATILFQRHRAGTSETDIASLRRALALFQSAADQGVAPACLNVSNIYTQGIGVEKNEKLGLQWLVKAAKQGDPMAQAILASRLSKGDGIDKDATKGFKLFERAATSGRPVALFNVGVGFLGGIGVDKDVGKAIRYFKEAADQGFLPAKVNLALLYERGEGVPQDFDRAMALLQEVADDGHAEDVAETMEFVRIRRDQAMGGLSEPATLPGAASPSQGAGSDPGEAKPSGIVFESMLTDPGQAAGADTLEVHLDVGSNPEVAKRLMEEAAALPSLRRDEVVDWLRRRAKEEGIKVKAEGLVKKEDGAAVDDTERR